MRVFNEGAGAIHAGQLLMYRRARAAVAIAGGVRALPGCALRRPRHRYDHPRYWRNCRGTQKSRASPSRSRASPPTARSSPVCSTFIPRACPLRQCAARQSSSWRDSRRNSATGRSSRVDDPEWRKWMNQSFYVRQGVSFLEMTAAQRELGFGLLRAALSAKGVKQTRDIMKLNETLGELTGNNFDEYGEWRYHITIMGKPSATEPWGWQFDGHHAIINYFVLGDQVVMTPFFAGSEPAIATSGQVPGHGRPAGRAGSRPHAHQHPDRRAAPQGHPQVQQDRRREPDRSLERQRRPRLRRHPRHGPVGAAAPAAAGPGFAVRGQHGRRPRAREDGRSARAPGSHLAGLDRDDDARQRLLLPHPQPGYPDRVRSPAARGTCGT